MAISRNRIQATRRVQSQRAVWFRVSHNQYDNKSDVRGEKVVLEDQDSTNNQDSEEAKEVIS